MSERLVILGGDGQVGSWLNFFLAKREVVSLEFPDIDFEKPELVLKCLEKLSPTLVINAAAYTAVDRAEQEEAKALQINAKTPAALAEFCKRKGACFIHYSTDYVYDGTKDGEYVESDPTNPLNAYGRTKEKGDRWIGESGCKHFILRTSWIYSKRGSNFFLTMQKFAREREEMRVVNDQWGSPNYAKCLAEATVQLVNKSSEVSSDASGVYHFVSPDKTTWFEFAKNILELDPNREKHSLKNVLPVTTEEYGLKTKRPLNARLDVSKLRRVFDIQLPPWRQQLAELFNA